MFQALFFHAAGLWRLPFSQLLPTVYIWQPSRYNLISLSAPCVEPSMISPDVSPLVTPSAFREECFWKHSWIFTRLYHGKCPTVFFHISVLPDFSWGSLTPQRMSFNCLSWKYHAQSEPMWEGLYLKVFWSVQKSYSHGSEFFFILISSFAAPVILLPSVSPCSAEEYEW